MIKHGADVVLCQHSHCIGCYEEYMGGHILYGQGNFHFICKEYEDPADEGYMSNTGLLTVIDITDKLSLKFLPCVADTDHIRLANEGEKAKILNELYERSKSLKDGSWYDKFREFALSQARYRIFPAELHEEIAHYFDCESHTDACKEIYQTYNITNELD
jgi:poly-gamma-glutamate synthesis protein (capsule biosynthesis protein)